MSVPLVDGAALPDLAAQPGWLDELPDERPALAVDLSRCGSSDAAPPLRRWLLAQPVPTIAFTGGGNIMPDEGFDLVAEDQATLEKLLVGIEQNPRAAAICCQVSRSAPDLDVHAGLRLESLAYATLQGGGEFRRWLEGCDARSACTPASPVSLERADKLLRITLNSPENRNALSVAMRDNLTAAFRLAAMDKTIEQVLVDARGPAFCAGGDLSEFGSSSDPGEAHRTRLLRMPAFALAEIAGRVQCLLHGACIGAGIELPAFAASVIARPDARFRLPEVSMGLIPGAGGCVSIPRRIGRRAFNALAISGREIHAEEALALGLIDRIEAGD